MSFFRMNRISAGIGIEVVLLSEIPNRCVGNGIVNNRQGRKLDSGHIDTIGQSAEWIIIFRVFIRSFFKRAEESFRSGRRNGGPGAFRAPDPAWIFRFPGLSGYSRTSS